MPYQAGPNHAVPDPTLPYHATLHQTTPSPALPDSTAPSLT